MGRKPRGAAPVTAPAPTPIQGTDAETPNHADGTVSEQTTQDAATQDVQAQSEQDTAAPEVIHLEALRVHDVFGTTYAPGARYTLTDRALADRLANEANGLAKIVDAPATESPEA